MWVKVQTSGYIWWKLLKLLCWESYFCCSEELFKSRRFITWWTDFIYMLCANVAQLTWAYNKPSMHILQNISAKVWIDFLACIMSYLKNLCMKLEPPNSESKPYYPSKTYLLECLVSMARRDIVWISLCHVF